MTAKAVMITGTSSGFGQATVDLFLARGWNVVATRRAIPESGSTGASGRLRIVALELNDPASIQKAATDALAAFGRIDALINNAGYFQMGPLETTTMEQFRAQFETNVFGLVGLTKALLPSMREAGGGTIINVSSVSAENGYPFGAAYSASKAAVMVVTEALNLELDPLNISVKAILPGLHATGIFTKIDMADSIPAAYRPMLKRFLEMQRASGGSAPEGVAELIYEAVTDGKRHRVRYFAGKDAVGIPTMKRLLGQEGYFHFFRNNVLNGPGRLVRCMTPSLPEKVKITPKLDQWTDG